MDRSNLFVGTRIVCVWHSHWSYTRLAVDTSFWQLVLLPFMPESPKYLILNRNNNTLGRKSLERLRETQEEVEEEFEEMQEESERARTSDRMNIIELLVHDMNDSRNVYGLA